MPLETQREVVMTLLSVTTVLHGVGWSTLGSGRFVPGKETRYHCIWVCVGPRAVHGEEKNLLRQSGFEPRTIQCVANRYYLLLYPGPEGIKDS